MHRPTVVVVDYGLGNLFSVEAALRRIGADVRLSRDPAEVRDADRLILPGVGAFGDGMRNLRDRGMSEAICDYARSGRPMLGVCLGMQLLMTESEEFGLHQGLDLIPGRVVRLRTPAGDDRFRIPHIGWNTLHASPDGLPARSWPGTILDGLSEAVFMYFLHSYVVVPRDPVAQLAVTRYGYDTFCSVLQMGNVAGVQFHPERSAEAGVQIYATFVHGAGRRIPTLVED